MDAIRTDNLCKHYGPIRALDRVSLCVPAGSIFGFLGPNGAGKTTTIRILMGLMRASDGNATVLGMDAWRDSVGIRRRVGYLAGDLRLYEQMTIRDTLRFVAGARGMDGSAEISRLAERFDLDLSRRVRACSKGMKQKLGLIQALMHKPDLLILDEPTSSLDPLVQQTLYEEIRAAAARGATVLFSSHTLSEVESLCEYVAIVRGGRLVEQDRIDHLRARAVRRVEFALRNGAESPPPGGFHVRQQSGRRCSGAWTGDLGPLLAWLAQAPIDDVTIGPPDLEDLFLAYYGHEAPAGTEGAA